MQHIYGGRKNFGTMREKHASAAGKIIRQALQALEEQGVLIRYNDPKNKSLGNDAPEGDSKLFARVVSSEGQRELNEVAKDVFNRLLQRTD